MKDMFLDSICLSKQITVEYKGPKQAPFYQTTPVFSLDNWEDDGVINSKRDISSRYCFGDADLSHQNPIGHGI